MNIFNGLQHIGIPTVNFDTSKEFYQKLGFSLIQTENNQGNRVGFFIMNNLTLELYEDNVSTCNGAINHLALDTDNINKAFKEIESLGIKIEDGGIQKLPFWKRGIQYFNFYGPNGEIFEVCQINEE